MEQQPEEQPATRSDQAEQTQNPEEMTHVERIQHIQYLAKDIKRQRTEYIARAMNTRRTVV